MEAALGLAPGEIRDNPLAAEYLAGAVALCLSRVSGVGERAARTVLGEALDRLGEDSRHSQHHASSEVLAPLEQALGKVRRPLLLHQCTRTLVVTVKDAVDLIIVLVPEPRTNVKG